MYSFHLTIDVREGCSDPYEAYKKAAVELSAQAAGHLWSLVVRADARDASVYYQLSSWGSERELDLSGSGAGNVELIARTQPYEMLNRTPALREPGRLIAELPQLDIEGLTSWPCLHRTHRFASETAMRRVIESSAQCSGRSHAHAFLAVGAEPKKVYEIQIGGCSARENTKSAESLGAVREAPCRIVLLCQ